MLGFPSPLLFEKRVKNTQHKYPEEIGSSADIAKKSLEECLQTIAENKETLPKFFVDWLAIHSNNLAAHGKKDQKDKYRASLEGAIAEAKKNNNDEVASRYTSLLQFFDKKCGLEAKPVGDAPPQSGSRLVRS